MLVCTYKKLAFGTFSVYICFLSIFQTPPCARHSIEVDRFPLQVRSDFHPSKSEKEWGFGRGQGFVGPALSLVVLLLFCSVVLLLTRMTIAKRR